MIKKSLATLAALPLLAFGLDVGGSLGVETGYRFDNFKLTGIDTTNANATYIEKVRNIKGLSLALNGRLTLDNFYIRAKGAYNKIFSTPEDISYSNGVPNITVYLSKEHGFNFDTGFGHLFMLGVNDEFRLGPEAGFAYQKLYINSGDSEAAGSPFVGFQFAWDFDPDWMLNFVFDFHFYGFRRSSAQLGSSDNSVTYTGGHYLGPEAKLSFDYAFAHGWDLGVAYDFKYIITGEDTFGGYRDGQQSWMTNTATFNVNYMF